MDSSFNRDDYSQAISYIEQAILTKNEDSRDELLSNAKSLGLTWDKLGNYEQGKKYQEELKAVGIESYDIGSNYISTDQIAQLHKGEAVLTKATTADLKETLGTNDIKNWSSQSLTDNLSNGFGSISSVIVSQTEALVAKMNEIISTIINKNNPVQSVSRTTVAQRDITSLSLS